MLKILPKITTKRMLIHSPKHDKRAVLATIGSITKFKHENRIET